MNKKTWVLFLFFALFCGTLLRLIYPSDMEWKEDEYYNYIVAHLIATGERPLPWVGMNSGVYIANPGMSVWTFALAAKIALIFGGGDPLALATAVRCIALLGCALVLPCLAFSKRSSFLERETWSWAFAFSMVNPFLIYYHRKLWPQAFLPIFCVPWMATWMRRDLGLSAFFWGLLGALLGQVHMAGFFSAASLAGFTAASECFSRWGSNRNSEKPLIQTKWRFWFLGSFLGALPLIPWLNHLFTHPTGHALSSGLSEVYQLKFWIFWITDALGLHLGNPLGIHRGGAIWGQISDFARYPKIAGYSTWLCGAAHLIALGSGFLILGTAASSFAKGKSARLQSRLAENSMFFGFGISLSATLINIRRYYIEAAFPFPFFWFSRLSLENSSRRRAHALLFALWMAQLLISAQFVSYIHVNQGAREGDYGEAYHVIQERHSREKGEPWPDLKWPH